MAKIITFANQKGGVGKTTTALNIGGGLNRLGFKVLFIDLDSQCNLSFALRGKLNGLSSREMLLDDINVFDCVQHVKEGDLIPGSANLCSLDLELRTSDRAIRLKERIKPLINYYDYIVIDTPPTLGIATINVLGIVDKVVVPVRLDLFSLQGASQLYRTIFAVKEHLNVDLKISGILVIKDKTVSEVNGQVYDAFEKLATTLNTRVFETQIDENAIIKESIGRKQSIFEYAPNSSQANDYLKLIKEIFLIK